jgi:hypothetical protein
MENIIVNDELSFNCPDGFHRLSSEEIGKYNLANDQPGCVLRDEERHIIVSLAWKQLNPLLALFLNVRELIGRMAEYVAEANKDYGYVQGEFFTGSIAQKKSAGFDYSYRAGETAMDARMIMVRNRRTVYYLYFYFRSQNRQESLAVIEPIISSMNWKK